MVTSPDPGPAREAGGGAGSAGGRPPAQEAWLDGGPVSEEGRRPRAPGGGKRRDGRSRLPPEVVDELAGAVGQATAQRDRLRLEEATRAYGRERYADTLRLLQPLARRAPDVAAVRELLGLAQYRLGRWKSAIDSLEAAERMTGSLEHHPVLADCHRALGHGERVQALWEELRQGPASPEVVVEGRIVTAAAQADSGDVAGALRLLERGPVNVRRPRYHHLRLWYALAALHERAGDIARARQLFGRLLDAAPDFGDVGERYRALT